jgi:membrane protease YdiL (CAAX protease family)
MDEFAGPRWARRSWVRLLIMAGVVLGVDGLLQMLLSLFTKSAALTAVIGVAGAAVALAVYVWIVRLLERRRPVAEVSPRGAVAGVAVGLLVGAVLFSAVIGIIAAAGHYHVSGLGSVSGALAVLGTMCTTAVAEELLFRAVLFRMIERWMGTWLALAVSAVVFGLLHLANSGATLFGALAIALEAGVMLGAAYALTRTIWFAVGIHLAWNFMEGGVFSTTVSGTQKVFQGLLRSEVTGPDLLTGGGFGPEASVGAIGVGVVAAVVLLLLTVRRGRIVAMPGRQSAAAALTAEDQPIA